MKLKLLLIVVLVAGGAAAIAVSMGGLSASAAATTYLTSAAAIGTVSDDVAATGTIESTARYGLAFGTAAHAVSEAETSTTADTGSTWGVASVEVEPGDSVKKGDVLATGDATDLQADLSAATANRRSAAIQLVIAEDQLADAEDDDNTDAIRQGRISVYSAESQLAQAKATEQDLKAQLVFASLTAPIDGIVSEVNIAAGSDATSGDAIVVEARTYEVTTDVVEGDISSIAVGQPATVSVTALSGDAAGTVTAIAQLATVADSEGVVSFAVTVALDDALDGLLPGMSAEVTITTASASDVLTIPSAALNGADGRYTVQVLGASGVPEARSVSVGLVTASLAEITDGLSAGEVVVTGTATQRTGTTTQTQGGAGPGGAVPGGAIPGGGGFR